MGWHACRARSPQPAQSHDAHFGGVFERRWVRPDGVLIVAPDCGFAPRVGKACEDFSFGSSSRSRPTRLSMQVFRVGFAGATSCRPTPVPFCRTRIARPVGSASFSLTMTAGVQCSRISLSNSRATRRPESDVSAAGARHSCVRSSITTRAAEPAPGLEHVRNEVERPAFACVPRRVLRCPPSVCRLAAAAALHRKPLLLVQTAEFLLVHPHPLALEHGPDAAIAEAPALARDLAHAGPDLRIVGVRLAPHRLGVDANQPAGAALRQPMPGHRHESRFPPAPERPQTLPNRSFRATLSSIASASSLFSRAFSVSGLFSLRALSFSRMNGGPPSGMVIGCS